MISTDIQQEILERVEEEFSKLNLPEKPQSLYEPVRYMLSKSGKRIRPYFTLAGCGLCDGPTEEAVPAAIAIELLHNFTLLHDDIMDSASTRRGRPSVFKKWNSSTAILSGDAMYAWAFGQLQYYGKNEHFSKTQYAHILDIFLDSAKTVCEGQSYDLDFETKRDVELPEYLQMIRGKTAALISGSFKMGGMVAGADEMCLDRLEAIGNHVGVGFQIQDDLLDVVADPHKFGKTIGGDILEGKKTYLHILSLERGSDDERRRLNEVLHKDIADDHDVGEIIDIYKKLGVIESAKQAIKEHYDEAISLIQRFGASPYQSDLIKFLTNLKNREY